MDVPLHANLTQEGWTQPREGRAFEVSARSVPWLPTGRWPRSGSEDAREAVEAASGAQPAWGSLGRSERGRLLARVPEALERIQGEGELLGVLAGALGLEPEELGSRLSEEVFRFRESIEFLREGEDAEGAGVFQAHWSDFLGGLGARVASRLLAGRTVVLFSDPRLPEAAEALGRAVEQADLPPGVFSLLHDDVGEGLRAGLDATRSSWARLKGNRRALQELHERLGDFPEAWNVWALRNTTYVVSSAVDPAREAASVVEKALGRSSTLSGQLPGQVGRVACPQRVFSRFSEELLGALEVAPDVQRPVPAIEEDLPQHVRRAWALGLDEGAAPIFAEESLVQPAESGDAEPPGAKPPQVVSPVVFTNVEPGHRFARLERPAPVLGLIRAASDEAAAELARELDGGLTWTPQNDDSKRQA